MKYSHLKYRIETSQAGAEFFTLIITVPFVFKSSQMFAIFVLLSVSMNGLSSLIVSRCIYGLNFLLYERSALYISAPSDKCFLLGFLMNVFILGGVS